MKEITIKGYEFAELNEGARDRVRQWHIEGIDWEWWNYLYAEFVEKCEAFGIEIGINDKHNNNGYTVSKSPEIYFSGFYSQGDGLAFNAHINALEYLQKTKKTKKFWQLYSNLKNGNVESHVSIEHVGRYYSMNKSEDLYIYSDKITDNDDLSLAIYNMADALSEEILDHCRDLASDLYRDLENEYEGMLTDEYIADECEANEYLFDEYGRLI